MKKFNLLKIIIAKIKIEISIERSFKNIYNLFSRFEYCQFAQRPTIKIIIKKSLSMAVTLSKNSQKLIISGNDIDDLKNSFNLIGILQAIFRFIGIHSSKNGIYLLHGSTSILNNKSICFADDGRSTAKTLSSVECASKSNQYIGDEFCFFESKTKKIFSYPFIPIHFRPEVKNHFINIHKIKLPRSFYQENKAGYFIDANKIFKIVESKQLDKFVFVYFHNQKTKLEPLGFRQSKKAIAVTIATPLLKLFYPQLDRMQFLKKQDLTKARPCNKTDIRLLIKNLNLENAINQIAKEIPCYRVWIRHPCEIIKMIQTIK